MASRPLEHFVTSQIEANGGWDACVFERIEAGETQTAVAASYGISQGWLSRIIHKSPELTQRFNDARRQRARVYAEQAKELADNVGENRDAIAKVREQIGVRRWLAAVDDRETFGEQQPAVNVSVNLAEIHIDALRHRVVAALPSREDITDGNTLHAGGIVQGVAVDEVKRLQAAASK